jgi:hypothetical protein
MKTPSDWDVILGEVRKRVPPHIFAQWFETTSQLSHALLTTAELCIIVRNEDHITELERLAPVIQESAKAAGYGGVPIHYFVPPVLLNRREKS